MNCKKVKTCEKFEPVEKDRKPMIKASSDVPGMFIIRDSNHQLSWLNDTGKWLNIVDFNVEARAGLGCYFASHGIAQAIIDTFCPPKDSSKATGHAYPCYYRDTHANAYRVDSPGCVLCWQEPGAYWRVIETLSEYTIQHTPRLLATSDELLADLKAERNLPAHLQKLISHIESGGEKKLDSQKVTEGDWKAGDLFIPTGGPSGCDSNVIGMTLQVIGVNSEGEYGESVLAETVYSPHEDRSPYLRRTFSCIGAWSLRRPIATDWLARFYPETAEECVERSKAFVEAHQPVILIAHALRKWEGFRADVLEKYGLRVIANHVEAVGQTDALLSVVHGSCGLCMVYMCKGKLPNCPIYLISTDCCSSLPGMPWNSWCGSHNPEPMITLLKKALAEAQGKEKCEPKGEPREPKERRDCSKCKNWKNENTDCYHAPINCANAEQAKDRTYACFEPKPRVPKERRVGGKVRIDSLGAAKKFIFESAKYIRFEPGASAFTGATLDGHYWKWAFSYEGISGRTPECMPYGFEPDTRVTPIYDGPERRLVTKQPEVLLRDFGVWNYCVKRVVKGRGRTIDEYLADGKWSGTPGVWDNEGEAQAALEAYYESTGQLEKPK